MDGIVLVMGLPATGKTTLCNQLQLQQTSHRLRQWSYDDFPNLVTLKEKGAMIFEQVQLDLSLHGGISFVDDNFHLHSMRKPYLRLCQQKGYGFAIIWLQEDMNVLTERDRLRECSVGEEVIRKMVTKFEKPESNELAYIVESPVSLASVLETLYRTRSIHQSSLKTTSQIEPTINPLHELNLAMNRFIHQRVSSCPDPTQQHIMATKLGIRKKNILKACKHDPSMMMETMAQLDILMSREDA